MTWQLGVVGVMVGVAALYLVWSAWRTLAGKKSGCGGGCRCDAGPRREANGRVTMVPVDQVGLRQRPQSRS